MNTLEARRRILGRNVYKRTTEGNPAIAQGSLARMYPGITMQGWTEQDSTTGAQLFDKSTVIKNKYINDSTGEMYDKAEGDTSASDYVLVRGLSYIRVTTTTFAQWMAFYDINKDFISGINDYGEPIQVPQNAEYARFTIPNPVVDTFMVNAGSELLPWEPYTGRKPSPSPDYPQPITSAGKWNEETQKWEYGIEVSNAENNPIETQSLTLQSDRPLTKWDKLGKRNGQWGWVYKSAEIVLDGTEKYTGSVDYVSDFSSNCYTVISNMARDGYTNAFMNRLSNIDYSWSQRDAIGFSKNFSQLHVRISNSDLGTTGESSVSEITDAMKAYMAQQYEDGNPFIALYETAEETFVPLSESEQEQMNELYTFRPTTVLSNDCGCNMTLTYKTKKSLEVTT